MASLTEKTTSKALNKPRSRRRFMRESAAVGGGLATILASGVAPAVGQERELKVMVHSHFVPAADDELERQLKEFGKMEGIKTRFDRVAHLQLPAVLAGEVQGQKGHDIISTVNANPHLYSKHLVDVGDIYDKVGAAGGGWTNDTLGKGREGQQSAMPWYFISFPIAIRTDLVAEIGENLPDTWDDVLRIGTKLKKMGHPVGIQLSHGADSNWILRGMLWSWGAKLVEADSKTIAVNSKETVDCLKFVRELYQNAMETEVLAWDDRNNNVCLASGKCSMILNPISAYRSAVRDKALIKGTDRPVHQVINHIMPPKGPAGRHMAASHISVGIWNFSKNVPLAKKFLEYHFSAENAEKHLQASAGYNQPLLKAHALHPLYASNAKYYFAPFIGWYTHAIGWPGVPTAASQTVYDQYLLPDAAAACATGKASAEEAVQKLEAQMKRIYRRFK